MADTYAERFGHPPSISQHAIERMNTLGVSPHQLAEALQQSARTGTSPGTVSFVGRWVTVVANDEGLIVTIYESR
jgi:hypothetical protein